LGLEVSGIIEALGTEASIAFASSHSASSSASLQQSGALMSRSFKVGDRVMALLSGGGYAEYATCHYKHVMHVPENLTLEQAAAIPEVFLTAYQTYVCNCVLIVL